MPKFPKASAVQPDIRVETQDTLSLGEDRTVLATTADVAITRAGIFKLSFVMPAGFDVESISGAALSHWTELKTDAGRVITLNLNGRTEGQQQFVISLSGPGLKTASAWAVPQILLREADKQRGTLLVVPEQGMRWKPPRRRRDAARPAEIRHPAEGRAGVPHPGDAVEARAEHRAGGPVDPGMSLQHATVSEALVKVAANLQYQIENAGLKEFRVLIPTNAEGVTFHGDQLGDSLAVESSETNGMQAWDRQAAPARHRPVFVASELPDAPVTEQSGETVLRGVQAEDVNLQRGFATVQSAGRLQVRVNNLPASLDQPSGRPFRARCKRICPPRRRISPTASSSRISNCP